MISLNDKRPDDLDITRRILGDGGEWVFPAECPHCQYEMYKSDIDWIDGRTAVCPNCGEKVYGHIVHERDGKHPKKEPVEDI